ncbi:hypothetical protein JAAARDRAFT_267449 [Jaapia argillacea MUCL 33604]|uniref:Uncharacterized protein n=1 Tax=Jaapia argillacea MUCL 33604 TaxID=933084 RepID=A0A067Q229_9AGAM|nr:hypothetical protein JAAARDRAFT_267449 [Jaapia argillacea MUCL 33604]
MVARDASPGPGWATLREPTASTAPSETEEDYQAIQHTTSTKKRKPPQGPSPQRKPKFPRLANANESIDPTPKKGTARKSAATARAASRSGSGSARLRDNGDLSRSPPPRRSQPSSGAGPPQIAQSITEAYSSRPSGSTSALPSRPRSSNSSSTDDNTRTRTFVKDSGPSSSARPTTPPLSRRGFGATNPLNRRNTSMGIPFRRQRTPESSRDSTSSPDLPDTLSQSLTQGQSRNPPKRHGKEAQSTRVIAMSGSRAHEKRRATISHRETPVSPAKSDQTMTPIHNRNRARNNVSKDRRKTMQTISISSDERASPDPLPNTQRRLSRGPVLQGTGKVDDPLTIIDDDDDDDIPAIIDLDDSDEEGTPPSVSLFPNRVQSQPVREQSHVDDDDDPFASNPPLDVPQVYSPDNTHEDWMQDTEQDASFNPDSTADPGAMDIAVSPHVTTEHIAPDAIELASPNILNADQLFAVQATESSQEHGNHPSESLVMPIDVHSVAIINRRFPPATFYR